MILLSMEQETSRCMSFGDQSKSKTSIEWPCRVKHLLQAHIKTNLNFISYFEKLYYNLTQFSLFFGALLPNV